MSKDKARFWVGVCYTENMQEKWKDDIGDILQIPYAYCVHDKDFTSDMSEHRKEHVHIIIAFSNTTTYNHAYKTFSKLNDTGKVSINKCEMIIGIRNMYDYLIHDTESCRKKGKFLYPKEERICGNNFDIGLYEQLTLFDKLAIKKEMANLVPVMKFRDFYSMNDYVMNNMTLQHYQVFTENQGYYANLIRGYYNNIRSRMCGEDKVIDNFFKLEHIKVKDAETKAKIAKELDEIMGE